MYAPFSQSVSSVAQSCPTLCDPVNRSTPGLPVHHQHPEFTQTTFIELVMPSNHLILCRPLLLLTLWKREYKRKGHSKLKEQRQQREYKGNIFGLFSGLRVVYCNKCRVQRRDGLGCEILGRKEQDPALSLFAQLQSRLRQDM